MTLHTADEPLGDHVLELEITRVVEETADARSLEFGYPSDAARSEPPRYRPGQFLTLRVPSDRTGSVARCYSLSGSPVTGDPLTVTVKRTAKGYASNWLCDNARVGMRLHVLAPSGTFVPATLDTDLLLVAAGSGITPVMSILRSALAAGTGAVKLIYANRDEDSIIFGAALDELADRYGGRLTVAHWLESQRGLPDPGALAELVAPFTAREVFVCGPGPFMDAAREALISSGTPGERIHVEVFRSLGSDPFAAVDIGGRADGQDTARAVVTLDGVTTELAWPREAKLLDVLLDAGLDAPFSCREGHCGACAVVRTSGEVDMEVNDALEDADLDDGLILACQAHPRSDAVHVSYDE
ncbi:ferredoxin--NADP reductase [Mycobacterium sp. MBM]|nr:ferredoxin--NADP reductase [Mycobacterium sp. MBM]